MIAHYFNPFVPNAPFLYPLKTFVYLILPKMPLLLPGIVNFRKSSLLHISWLPTINVTTSSHNLTLLSLGSLGSVQAWERVSFARGLSLDSDKLQTWNLVQWYCTMSAFEKINQLVPAFLYKIWISSYYFQRAITPDRNRVFQFCFLFLKV